MTVPGIFLQKTLMAACLIELQKLDVMDQKTCSRYAMHSRAYSAISISSAPCQPAFCLYV